MSAEKIKPLPHLGAVSDTTEQAAAPQIPIVTPAHASAATTPQEAESRRGISAARAAQTSGMLAAVEAGINEANREARREFTGVRGTLPAGTSRLLIDIVDDLLAFLHEEKGLSDLQAYLILKGKRRPNDDAIKLAIRLLRKIRSAFNIKDGTFYRHGKPLSASASKALLFSGQDGFAGSRVRDGAKRGADIAQRTREAKFAGLQAAIDMEAQRNPRQSYRAMAQKVAKQFQCDERTVRRHTSNPRHRPKK